MLFFFFLLIIIIATKHKGYGFVEYELPEDCQAAIDNMHMSEIYGRVIKVQLAKPHNMTATSNRAGKFESILSYMCADYFC